MLMPRQNIGSISKTQYRQPSKFTARSLCSKRGRFEAFSTVLVWLPPGEGKCHSSERSQPTVSPQICGCTGVASEEQVMASSKTKFAVTNIQYTESYSQYTVYSIHSTFPKETFGQNLTLRQGSWLQVWTLTRSWGDWSNMIAAGWRQIPRFIVIIHRTWYQPSCHVRFQFPTTQ